MDRNLFGELLPLPKANKHNYTAFIDKFKPKLTTDDCYTPKEVYDAVFNWVSNNYNLTGLEVLRPFKPNGDYQAEEYKDNTIVIDNPPFSILSEICRFYERENIKYFLFAPHLTLFSIRSAQNYIISNSSIIYHNGAVVNTGFVSNLFGDDAIILAPDLHYKIKDVQVKVNTLRPKYKYPNSVISVSRLAKIINAGLGLRIKNSSIQRISALDSQYSAKKGLYGSGFLCSDNTAQEIKAQEIKAQDNVIIWALSEREKTIIKQLK